MAAHRPAESDMKSGSGRVLRPISPAFALFMSLPLISGKLTQIRLADAAVTDLAAVTAKLHKLEAAHMAVLEENKKLQKYKIQVDSANDQIAQLKSVIANYQMAMEGRGPAEELGLTEDTADGGKKKDGDDDVVVKLRD